MEDDDVDAGVDPAGFVVVGCHGAPCRCWSGSHNCPESVVRLVRHRRRPVIIQITAVVTIIAATIAVLTILPRPAQLVNILQDSRDGRRHRSGAFIEPVRRLCRPLPRSPIVCGQQRKDVCKDNVYAEHMSIRVTFALFTPAR